jgi:uracil-DNA glycosylase
MLRLRRTRHTLAELQALVPIQAPAPTRLIDLPIPTEWQLVFERPEVAHAWAALSAELEAAQPDLEQLAPHLPEVLKALSLTAPHQIRVVILGQDPYPGSIAGTAEPVANGLAFSTRSSNPSTPASLRNILSEIAREGYSSVVRGGDLTPWTGEGGVLLLNSCWVLTRDNSAPKLKDSRHWKTLISSILREVQSSAPQAHFLVWGAYATEMTRGIPSQRLVVTTHPSPLSASKASRAAPAFDGSNCFSEINHRLTNCGLTPITW